MKIGISLKLSSTICFVVTSITVFLTPGITGLHPIILVPGDGGSQMDAKLNKPSVVHYICSSKSTDFFNIWLNMELLAPVIIDCWIDNVRLVYNMTTRKTENSPGVQIRVPGFGNTTTVEYLDPSKASPGVYFQSIVESSLIPLGYSRNADIRGAPYDFRKAPNEMQDWMVDFKALVEHSYVTNSNQSVVLLAHSMGSPLSLYFLNQMTQAWKDQHVRALITLGGVWGGSVKALKVFAAGDDLGAYVLPAHTLRGQQRTSPSTAWLLPSKQFWSGDETLVELAWLGNVTVNNYKDFFDAMDYPVGYEMRKDTENLIHDLPHPGVDVHCLYGSGVATVESLHYKDKGNFPTKPAMLYGNGDGTVNIRSLRGCLRWADGDPRLLKRKKGYSKKVNRHIDYQEMHKSGGRTQKSIPDRKSRSKPKIYHEEFPGVDHMAILKNIQVINYIRDTVGKMNLQRK